MIFSSADFIFPDFYFGQRYGSTQIHGTTDDDDEAAWRNMHIYGAYVDILTFSF